MRRTTAALRRRFVIVPIVLFWAAMTGWFVARELLPGAFSDRSPGYRGLLSGNYLIADHWMKISAGGSRIGYSHTSIDTDDADPVNRYRVYNETEMNLAVMGETLHVSVSVEAALDAMYDLQHFTFLMSSKDYKMRVSGSRKTGNTFAVAIQSGDSLSRISLEIPDDAVLYSPMLSLQLQQLKPGQSLRLKTFDPLSMSATDVAVRALRREPLTHGGASVETTVLSIESLGMEVLAWIDSEGLVLRQETPIGWTLEACDPRDAMNFDRAGQDARDLILELAVPVSGAGPDLQTAEVLRLRLKGVELDPNAVDSHRQSVVSRAAGSTELLLKADRLPAASPALAELPAGLEPFLASSPYVQTDDPDIRRRAASILAGETNSLQAALRIYDWVHTNVEKAPAISVPSAAAVLKVMSGDCNEHTYLFVALARAAGLPARIFIGLTYSKGAFYYHAWPAVYVGRWLEMDPTLGRPAVGATHIKLLEGELKDQMKLMTFVGRVSIEVLDD